MELNTKTELTKLTISVLTIITTILGASIGSDYRATERTAAVHEQVSTVQNQNREILDALGLLLDNKLKDTAQTGKINRDLNLKILNSSDTNTDLNKKILDRLDYFETEINLLKHRK